MFKYLKSLLLTLFCLTGLFVDAASPKPLIAAGRAQTAPVIDGKLDDPCWQSCIEAGNFTKYPGSGAPGEKTRTMIAYDKDNLYIAFKCEQEILDPKFNMLNSFKAEIKERDNAKIFRDESVEIFLQPDKADKYFQICVNANGAVYDALGAAKNWNAPITANSAKGNGFWTVEIAIPLKSLSEHSIIPGKTTWKINFCRNNRAQKESCSWSPAPRGFHAPESFGTLNFEESVPGISKIQLSGLDGSKGSLNAIVKNATDKPVNVDAEVIIDANQVRKVSSGCKVATGKTRGIDFSCPLPSQQKENFLKYNFKDKRDKTDTIGVSYDFYLKSQTKYVFKARVKSNLTQNGKAEKYCIFYIYNKENKKYIPLQGASIPLQASEWTEVKTEWTSPGINKGALWIIKWGGRNIKGDIQIDDVFLGENGSDRNLIVNGDFSKGRQSWSTLRNLETLDDVVDKFSIAYSFAVNGKTYCRSAFQEVVCARENSLINSKLVNFNIIDMESESSCTLDELYICEGSAERVNLIVGSSETNANNCFVDLLLPEFCRLVSPAGRESCVMPRKISEKIISREGKNYRQYRLELGFEAISRSGAPYWQNIPIPLSLEIRNAVPGDSGIIEYRAGLNDKKKEPYYHKLKIVSLPPLYGAGPEKLPFILWSYPSSHNLRELSEYEQEKFIAKIAYSGYNLAHLFYEQKPAFEKFGIKAFAQLPTISISGHFPGLRPFLANNPQYSAVFDTGKKANTVSPYLLTRSDFPFLKEMEKVIAAYVKHYPENLIWDYEHNFLQNGRLRARIGFSKENLELFKKEKNIPVSVKLDTKLIYGKYRREWIDFRCSQNAQAVNIYRKFIKTASPDCRFSFYSSYQPGSRENYGADWKKVSPYIDFAVCGYGGNAKLMLEALKQKYFVPGLLALRPIDQNVLEPVIMDFLFSSGSFMGYIGFVVDGRFFYKSSKAAAVARDFERFFLNLKSCRRDGLVSNTSGVQALEYQGERIVLIKNSSSSMKTVSFNNLNLPGGFVAINYDTKELYGNPQNITVKVKAEQTALIYLCNGKKLNFKPAAPSIQGNSKNGILRWKSDNGALLKYTLEYSKSDSFQNAIREANITKPFFQITETMTGKYYWRVRSENLNNSAKSSWSKAGIMNFSEDKLLDFQAAESYLQNAADKLGFWRAYRWGGGAPFGKSCKDYEVKHGGRYSLYTLNHFKNASTVWGNGVTAGSGTKFIQVKPGDSYKFSGWIKTRDFQGGCYLRLDYLDAQMRTIRSFRSQARNAEADWILLSTAGKAPDKTVSLRLFWISDGKGEAWCSELNLKNMKEE